MSEEKKAQGFMDAIAGQGIEDVGINDMSIPFLKILQKGNPECEDGNPARVPTAAAGMFMNTLTKQLYGKEIGLIPVKYEPVWLCWAPNRGGFKGRHKPGSIEVFGSAFDEGGMKDKDGNEVVENNVFYCLIEGHFEDGPIVLSLSSTGSKHAKNWNSMILMTKLDSGKRAPYFSSVWKLILTYNTNASGTWYQLGTKNTTSIERERFITEQEYIDIVAPARLMLDSVKVDFAQVGNDREGQRQIASPADASAY